MARVASLVLHYEVNHLTKNVLGDLLKQDYQDQDIYVIDNGSKYPFKYEHERVTVLRSETNRYITGGFNFGCNEALSREGYDYLWLITNDTRMPVGTLSSLVSLMEKNPTCGVAQTSMPSDHDFLAPSRIKKSAIVPFCEWTAPILRTAALLAVGWPDPDMKFWGMDLDWCYRASTLGWTSMVDYTVVMGHPYRGTWNVRPEIYQLWLDQHEDTVKVLIDKWGPGWQSMLWPESRKHFDGSRIDGKR